MKLNSLYIALAVLTLMGCAERERSVEENFSELLKNYSEKSSIEYDVSYRIKFFDYDDTTKLKTHCILIKAAEDTLFGGSIWYSRKDSLNNFTKYYDLTDLYFIDHNKKEVTRFDLEKNPPSTITGMVDGGVINVHFLKLQKLKKAIADSSNAISYLRKNEMEQINIEYKDDPPVFNQKISVYFDPLESLMKKKTFQAELDNQIQYNQWDLHNVEFNTTTKEDLENRFQEITKDYTFSDFEPRTEEEMAVLKNGSKAPEFSGAYFPDRNELFNSTDFKDTILILDFWYRSCHPCVKTIPQLNELHSKYKNQNVKIIGLNPYDNDSVSRGKLVNFIKDKKMEYPIVFVDTSVVRKFNVWSFPTLYLIDKNGHLVFSKKGCEENTVKEIDSVLKGLQ